ncbi:MAG: YebC/PmpR family DNA-binding transcriptional regulator [Firmicutes bacterium]|nr:YebC/PmpR family DNA-binding transcriptional regulator [Bacillota bacterium]
MGRAHEVRAASMAKTAAIKSKLYGRYGKEIFIAAKNGVPDPDMNLALRAKIKEAKSNHVPADVIKRAIDRAKGGDNSNYSESRYEGFGPGNCTVIVECLSDNANRTITEVRNAFNKSKGSKIGSAGSVSFGYQRLGVFSFESSMSEDEMFDLLLMEEVDATDIACEDGYFDIKVNPSDFAKAQEILEANIEGVEFHTCEVGMVPDEYVTLSNPDEIAAFNKLMNMLNESDDVNKVYHNAIIEE